MTRTTTERADRNWFVRSWRSHSIEDRWDVRRYVLSILWATSFVVFTPAALQPVLTRPITIVTMSAVIIGAIIAIVGRLRNEHLWLELGGVGGVLGGFGFYLAVNVVLIPTASLERIAQVLLVLLAMSYAVERAQVLVPRLIDVLQGDGDSDGHRR